MEILLIEGGRGTGKSTLSFKLRQLKKDTTLINPTGFVADGEDGLSKIEDYYNSWMKMLIGLSNHDMSFVFDRFYFSERVFSNLYKDYDFTDSYNKYNDLLEDLSHMGVKVNIVFLTINDEDELKNRLVRDKIPFGKAEENVEQTMKQQVAYSRMFNHIHFNYGNDNLKVHTVDTSHKNNDEVYVEVLQKLKTA